MLQKLPLRSKAIGFAIALGTIPVLSIGAVAYNLANRSITQDVMQYQKAYAVELADKISRFMFERYADIQAIANLAILNDPQVSRNTSDQRKQAVLNRYLDAYHVYDNIAVFDVSGNLVVKSKGEASGNHSDRDYFQQVLQTQKPIISKPQISSSNNEWAIYLAAPIKDVTTGQIIAVVRSRLPLKHLRERIKNLSNGEQESHLVDDSGIIFVTHNPKEIGQEVALEYPFLEQQQTTKQADVRVVLSQTDKTHKVLAIAPSPHLEGMPNLNWLLLVDNPTDVAFKAQRELLLTLLLGTGITALLLSAIAAVIANRTTQSINVIVSAITTSTTQIASTVEEQERIATQQAASVNQTTTTMNELGASSRSSAEQAQAAAESARQVLNLAEASASSARQVLNLAEGGTKTVDSTLQEMSSLKQKVADIAQQIMRLSEQASQISSITNLVSDLANQTNILALNAAVEAVRAGEHGKGFGVVASEIRKLADQSKKSADKINTLVATIQSAINSTVMVTDEGRKTAESGIQLSRETAEAFTNVRQAIEEVILSASIGVAEGIENVVVGNQQISLTAKEQAIAIQQVVEAMNSINQGAAETASGMTQTKAGIQKLNEAAQKLQELV